MATGMTRKLWLKLARHILTEHNRMSPNKLDYFPLTRQSSDLCVVSWQKIADCTDKGWPVLAHLEGAYNHFTVVRQVTERRVVLFDSDGQQWVQRRLCYIGSPDASKRFWIRPKGLIAVQPKSGFDTEL